MIGWIKASYARAPGSWLLGVSSAVALAALPILHFVFGVGR